MLVAHTTLLEISCHGSLLLGGGGGGGLTDFNFQKNIAIPSLKIDFASDFSADPDESLFSLLAKLPVLGGSGLQRFN